ncbi:MAG: redoxin domain-containing protein, partial [Bacteroidota bacterium]
MVKIGNKAPAFSLRSGEGTTVRLADLKGNKVVL